MEILYSQPFREDKNIGAYYNQVKDATRKMGFDAVCFTDGDSCFTTHTYGTQIADIKRKHPEGALFTCMTNRIYNKAQLHEGKKSENFNFLDHWKIGEELQKKYYSDVELLDNPAELLSGVLMLVPYWNNLRFKDGCLGVDNDFHKKCLDKRLPVYLMKGVYMFHYYRGHGEGKAHLL